MVVVGAEAGMGKGDGDVVVQGDDQTRRIEIRLRENKLLEQSWRSGLHPAPLLRLVTPDFRQARRIRIAKRTESIHGGRRRSFGRVKVLTGILDAD